MHKKSSIGVHLRQLPFRFIVSAVLLVASADARAGSLCIKTSKETASDALKKNHCHDFGQFGIAKVLDEDLYTDFNAAILRWTEFFIHDRPDIMQAFLDRGQFYKPMIGQVLATYDLPKELFYLAMIESGFRAKATSHARASGIWQFMKATGKRYGLKVDRYRDDRWDPVRSTHAAAQHLKDLKQRFGSWFLAMAAYNAGETRVRRAIRDSGKQHYWQLVRAKKLPKETRNYVAKFIAAASIAESPEVFHLRPQSTGHYQPAEVQVPRDYPLFKIAKQTGVRMSDLFAMNPHLKEARTPPGNFPYKLWIPEKNSSTFYKRLDRAAPAPNPALAFLKAPPPSQPTSALERYQKRLRDLRAESSPRKPGMSKVAMFRKRLMQARLDYSKNGTSSH